MNKQSVLFFLLLFFIHCFSCGKKAIEPEKEPIPHITKQPEVLNIQTSSAEISWETDVAANSVVHYGTASGKYDFTETKKLNETVHIVKLLQLQPNTLYYFVAESENSGGKVTSNEMEFTTLKTFSQLLDLAWGDYEAGNYQSAIRFFKEMTSRQPNFAEAYNGLGWCYAANPVDSLILALDNFTLAIQYQKTLAEAFAGRGFVFLAQKEYAKAIQDFNQVLTLAPEFIFVHDQTINVSDVHLGLAEAYFFRKYYQLAQIHVNQLAPENGLNPDDPATWSVDGTRLNTYTEALLAWIEKLKSLIG